MVIGENAVPRNIHACNKVRFTVVSINHQSSLQQKYRCIHTVTISAAGCIYSFNVRSGIYVHSFISTAEHIPTLFIFAAGCIHIVTISTAECIHSFNAHSGIYVHSFISAAECMHTVSIIAPDRTFGYWRECSLKAHSCL